MTETFILVHEPARRGAMRAVQDAPDGYMVTLSEPRQSDLMKRKYHAMIGDIRKQVRPDGREYSSVIWKAWLVDAYEDELKSHGEQLSKPSEVALSPITKHLVTLRASTTEFSKKEASGFIEYLYMFGAENDVYWTDHEVAEGYIGWRNRSINGKSIKG